MKRMVRFRTRVFAATATIAIACGAAMAGDINLQALTQETQKMSQKPDEMTLVWWIPEEFWSATFAQTPGMTPAQVTEFLKTVAPYTMVAVVDGQMGAFGGITYKSEEYIRSNTRVVDINGKSYMPLTEDKVDADTKNMLQMMKPVMSNMLGPMGQNMHFLLFAGEDAKGARIAEAKVKGSLTVRIGPKAFKWRLPLDSVLPVKMCNGCNQECKGSWSYCPWCGKKLGQ